MSVHPKAEPRVRLPVAKQHLRLWLWIPLTLLVVLVPVWYFAEFSRYALELPSADDVVCMNVRLRLDSENKIEFPASAEHVPKILAALRPAERDWLPSNWQWPGDLFITCKDGDVYRIALYWTYHPAGAFSVHRPGKPSGFLVSNYFRGGSDEALRNAIMVAYADYQAQLKDKQPKASKP